MATGTASASASHSRRSFLVFAFTAFATSLVLATGVVLLDPWRPTAAGLVPLVGLIAAFALFRMIAIEVDLRRDSLRVTLIEVPLVIGLASQPGTLVVVAFASVVAVVGLLRRDAPAKLATNLAISVNSSAVAALVVQFVDRGVAGAPEWAAILLGVGVGHALGTVTALCGLLLLPGSRRRSTTARLCLNSYLIGMLTAAAAIAGVEVLRYVPAGGALVVVVSVVLLVIYRGYYDLLHEQRDLVLINQVSLEVAGAGRSAEGQPTDDGVVGIRHDIAAALELSRDQLNASRVVLHRWQADGRATSSVAGEPVPDEVDGHDVDALLGPVSGGEQHRAVRVRVASADSDQQVALATRGAREVLVARLVGAEGELGVVEVHDRQSRLRGFDAADVRLLETLASHLTTALDNRRLLARLEHDAYHDTLTGLLNRLGFRDTARKRLERADAADRPAAVVLVDLELLASVNDALGHVWGDEVVVSAARRLSTALPEDVLVARLEGDTFAALLVDVDEPGAMATAAALRSALTEPYSVQDLALECNPVLGVALTGIDPTRDVDVLLQRADVALQAARTGDAAVRHYVPSMGQGFARRFQLVTQFRHALDSGQIDVHFQPQVALATRQVLGVEVLVRWQHPELGVLDPEEFVTVIETTGLIDALTTFVLDRALAQCREWLDRGLQLSVAVNLSVRSLADAGFPDRVAEALERHGVPATRVVLELTESAVMSDPERALPVLRALHNLGLRIAVDDFGTGYSSLSYLRRLPVDEVKIDKSFVLGMGSDLSDHAVVKAIVDLGHSLSLTVVAEGVEQDTARDQLVEMGCDVAQGYLISRPLGRDRFEAWLRARTEVARGVRDEAVVRLVR